MSRGLLPGASLTEMTAVVKLLLEVAERSNAIISLVAHDGLRVAPAEGGVTRWAVHGSPLWPEKGDTETTSIKPQPTANATSVPFGDRAGVSSVVVQFETTYR